MHRRLLYGIAITIIGSMFAQSAAAQAALCDPPGRPSRIMLDSLQAMARRMYYDVHGPRSRDSVTVVALMIDDQCRVLESSHGILAGGFTTTRAIEALLPSQTPRHTRAAGMGLLPSLEGERRMLVWGLVGRRAGTDVREAR